MIEDRNKGKTKSDELAYSLIGVNSFYGTPISPKAPDRRRLQHFAT
jgi:hypothetical protein